MFGACVNSRVSNPMPASLPAGDVARFGPATASAMPRRTARSGDIDPPVSKSYVKCKREQPLPPMAKKLPIVTLPDPVLRTPSAPVERVDDDLRALMDDMLETMYEAPGIGLAAVQVGIPRRMLVMDAAREEVRARNPIVMVNPEILGRSDETRIHEEGCLSIPEYYAEVERPAACTVRYLDRAGKAHEMLCEGLLATVVQHEVDHLDGVLFIDYLSRLKRERVIKKFLKARKAETAL